MLSKTGFGRKAAFSDETCLSILEDGQVIMVLSRVQNIIYKYEMLKPGDVVVTAVSGGPDSVALLHCLVKLKERLGLKRILAAHLNHMFRGEEADQDARFVENLAAQLGVECLVEKRNVSGAAREQGLSAQDAARRERYDFLYSTAEKYGAKIAVGHHADDQAETVLMHFLGGSGPEGLRAMEPVKGKIVRPLLFVRKKEIIEYCEKNDLKTREDPTNIKDIYLRNKIRLQLVPLLEEEYNPNLVDSLIKTSEIMRAENDALEKMQLEILQKIIKKSDGEQITLQLKAFLEQHLAVKRRIVRYCYKELSRHEDQGLLFQHVEDVLALAHDSETGSTVHLPSGVTVYKCYEELVFSLFSKEERKAPEKFFYRFLVPGELYVDEVNKVLKAELKSKADFEEEEIKSFSSGFAGKVLIDYDKITGDLFVRNRRRGDRFVPFGMTGTKKVKDFLIDRKISRFQRDAVPLITCGSENDDDIVWVGGLRSSELYKVDDSTSRVLIIYLENFDNEHCF